MIFSLFVVKGQTRLTTVTQLFLLQSQPLAVEQTQFTFECIFRQNSNTADWRERDAQLALCVLCVDDIFFLGKSFNGIMK